MQHLHGASSRSCLPVPALCFLVLWSVTALPVTKKAHGGTAAHPSGCPWVAAGGWMKPEAIQRDTCSLFLGGHRTAPLRGKEPPACSWMQKLLSFWFKRTTRLPWERQGGGPMWAGSPRLGTKQRDRFGGPRPSLGQHCISSHFHTCGFVGIPGCIPMNRELLSARGQLPSPAITPPSAWGRDPGRLGTPSSPSYIKSTTTTKRFQ